MRVNADRDLCVGSGNCVLTDPDVFDQNDEGLVEVLVAEPGDEHLEEVRVAVRRCPSGALSLDEA